MSVSNAATNITATPISLRALGLFFLLACAISWVDWLLVIASDKGWIALHLAANPWGSFGPAVAAMLLSYKAAGSAGLKSLFAPVCRWKFSAAAYGWVLLGPALLLFLAGLIAHLTGDTVLPLKSMDITQFLLWAVVILFVGGPLGEEIGWRGYALPALLNKYHPVYASLMVAVMWAIWHLPLFWLPGSAQQGGSVIEFIVLLMAFSLLTTWTYLITGNSLLAAILFHNSINIFTYFLDDFAPVIKDAKSFNTCFVIVTVCAALLAMLKLHRGFRRSD